MKTHTNSLTNEEIVKLAPSAGAQTPHEMVSDRYSFVPTIQAVDIGRSGGCRSALNNQVSEKMTGKAIKSILSVSFRAILRPLKNGLIW